MIELNKEHEPTQQEIQDFVNQVYNYAADLYVNRNMSWEEVKEELVRLGLPENDAITVVENLEEQEQEAKQKASSKEVLYGLLWLAGGIALTAITSGAYLFYGAILWGLWLIGKGIYHKMDL